MSKRSPHLGAHIRVIEFPSTGLEFQLLSQAMIGRNGASSGESTGRVRHVVHLVTSLEPGGLENGVVNLANSLNPKRYRTSIVCLERLGEFCHRLNASVTVECLEKSPGFQWAIGRRLGRRLRKSQVDLLHTHNLGPLIYGLLASWGGQAPWEIIQGEHAELRPDETVFHRLWTRRLGYRRCAAVHAVSEGLRRELVELVGLDETRSRAILNGVDCNRFSPVLKEQQERERSESAIGVDEFVIGIVGRFGAFKRHDRLLEAFEALEGRVGGRRLHLLVVGDHGPEKERMTRAFKATPFAEQISWVGFQLDPAPHYRLMDLLVIPSENEGLSNAMLEAMASGVPCLAHPACGAAEVIRDGENGWLRSMESADALAGELASLVGEVGQVASAGLAARKTAEQRFSLSTMIEGYARLYEEVLAKR